MMYNTSSFITFFDFIQLFYHFSKEWKLMQITPDSYNHPCCVLWCVKSCNTIKGPRNCAVIQQFV